MNDRVDRILELLDNSLQQTTEAEYSSDYFPDRCARCQRGVPVEGGDMCQGCREFLLGDTDLDPVAQRFVYTVDTDDMSWSTERAPRQPIMVEYTRTQFTPEQVARFQEAYQRAWQQLLERMRVALGPAVEQLRVLSLQLARTFGHDDASGAHAALEALEQAMRGEEPDLVELPGTPPSPRNRAEARGRARSGQVCPTHGQELRGGQCSRCARMNTRRAR